MARSITAAFQTAVSYDSYSEKFFCRVLDLSVVNTPAAPSHVSVGRKLSVVQSPRERARVSVVSFCEHLQSKPGQKQVYRELFQGTTFKQLKIGTGSPKQVPSKLDQKHV